VAGDWIKMRSNLWDDPRVSAICDATDQPEAMVVGGLYWLWATADQHTEDGHMPGLTLRQIDRKTGIQGFGAALCAIGWLTDSPDGVTLANFDDHNGASAKRRASDAQRKANSRSVSARDADTTRTGPGTDEDDMRRFAELEEEKRREEEKTQTPLASDWVLPKPWGEWALTEFKHWTPEAVRSIAEQFSDHFKASAGKSADWSASWRKWCRDELTQRAHPPPSEKRSAAPAVTVPSDDVKKTQAYLAAQAAVVPDPTKSADRRAAIEAAKRAALGAQCG